MSSDDQTHYELLGVDADASASTIRKAWRRRTDKAGPGSAEFGRLNEAADTLLDPDKRAAYDETLPQPEPTEDQAAEPVPAPRGGRRGLAWSGVGLLAVLTVLAIVVATHFSLRHRDQDRAETARTEAPAAAERALPVVLAYDYRHLPADRRSSEGYLTPSYRKKFDKTFDLLEKGTDGQPGAATQTKTVVTASVVGTAVMDADPDRVHVLAYVNQISRHGDQDPRLFQNRIAVSMVKSGGSWLIDGLDPR